MPAAQVETLPPQMASSVDQFFEDVEAWVGEVLTQGREDGSLRFAGTAGDASRFVVDTLEGAMLVARSHGGIDRFDRTAARVVAELTSETAAAQRPLARDRPAAD